MEHENPSITKKEEADFWSSVIRIEIEHWGNDLVGIKAVLMVLGCTAQKAEAALGSYLCASGLNPGLPRNDSGATK